MKSFIFPIHKKQQLIVYFIIAMAGKDGKQISDSCDKVGGKKKPLKQKKTERGPETEVCVFHHAFEFGNGQEDKAFKAKQKEEQAALKAMREKLAKKK